MWHHGLAINFDKTIPSHEIFIICYGRNLETQEYGRILMHIYFHIEFNTKFSFLQLPLLLHDKIQKRKAWYHCSLLNKARSYGTSNTSKKERIIIQ